jgi:hypothetical protein
VLVLGVLAAGGLGLSTGLSGDQQFAGATPESVAGQRLLAAHFGARTDDPVLIVAPAGSQLGPVDLGDLWPEDVGAGHQDRERAGRASDPGFVGGSV